MNLFTNNIEKADAHSVTTTERTFDNKTELQRQPELIKQDLQGAPF